MDPGWSAASALTPRAREPDGRMKIFNNTRGVPEISRSHEGELGGGNSNIFGIFTPKIGEDEPILASIFFKGVETTN